MCLQSDGMERGCHAFDKFMLPLFFAPNISSCCCQGGGAKERVRAHDKYIVLSSLFSQLYSPTLFGLLLICFIAVSLYCSQPLLYIYLFSFSLCLLPLCTIPSSPSPLLLSDFFLFFLIQAELWGQLLPSDLSCSSVLTTGRDCNHIDGEMTGRRRGNLGG